MSVTYSFCDNAEYSAEDINQITSRLVTSGIEDPFTDGVPYNLSAFNDAGMLLYTEGVVPETVNTLKVVKGENESEILIYPGTAFFADGAVITVEVGGHTLTFVPNEINYVYLKNDLINTNTCYPVCSTQSPTGDYVLLAEISESGEITDKRTYAMGKLPGYASDAQHLMKINDYVSVTRDVPEASKCYRIGDNNYRFLLVVNHGDEGYPLLGLYSFENNSYLSFSRHSASKNCDSVDYLYVWHEYERYLKATVEFADGLLTMSFQFERTITGYFTDDVPITFYLF